MGLIDTISLFGAAVLALPIGLLGAEFLLRGRTLAGVGFLALGAALLAGRYYLPGVTDEVAGGLANVVLGDAAENDDADPDGGRGGDGTRE
jgi:hypothetical protein